MAERTCSVDGCDKPHRARGLCSTHYNHQHQPSRHAAKSTACVVCGQPILRPTKRDRRPTCSVSCRTLLEFGAVEAQGRYDWATDAMRRALLAGVADIDRVERVAVFERDHWTCYLCHVHLDPDADAFDPASPTVDHVVPLSRGGAHTYANVRACCLGCNSAKQAA